MTEPARRAVPSLAAASESPTGEWPHQLGQEPTLRVGDVLAALTPEFPSLTLSKLRFLDAQGLVSPGRTASGYRQYSVAHIERLRYVLRQQRDAFAPLGRIRDALRDLDAGLAYEPLTLGLAGRDEAVALADVARSASVETETVSLLVREGLISTSAPGAISAADVTRAVAFARYLSTGADVRELKALVRGAQRERDAARAASVPLQRRDERGGSEAARQARLEAASAAFDAALYGPDAHGA